MPEAAFPREELDPEAWLNPSVLAPARLHKCSVGDDAYVHISEMFVSSTRASTSIKGISVRPGSAV